MSPKEEKEEPIKNFALHLVGGAIARLRSLHSHLLLFSKLCELNLGYGGVLFMNSAHDFLGEEATMVK